MPGAFRSLRAYRIGIPAMLAALILLAAMCETFKEDKGLSEAIHPNGKRFAGSASCESCHQSVYNTHVLTAHFLTSRPADTATVKGSFVSKENVFALDARLKVVMTETEGKLTQTGFVDGWEVNSRPMDVVIGSGRKGQTYLYWRDDELFQLPVSYYTPLSAWCNSPGYPTDQILFNRNIPGRCLECHGTYFKTRKIDHQREVFDRSQVIYGVDCERCHGPAADHVAFQREHPDQTKGQFIVNPAPLSRQQKLDNCALCHSGIRENLKPSFSFIVGDKLEDYSVPDYKVDSAASLDVHGNQYGLLTASKCFKMSDMDCSSCHNVHVKESSNIELFSTRCLTCHTPENHNFCKQKEVKGLVLRKNCIDCHMPALPSNQIFLQVADKSRSTPDLVRTHLVGIYKERIKMYLEKIKARGIAP
jgi:hypothetical protein